MRSLVRWGLLFAMIAAMAQGCRNTEQAPLKEIQRVRAGVLDVVVLSPTGALRQGKLGRRKNSPVGRQPLPAN